MKMPQKQSNVHQLIITLRHTVTVWTKDRGTEDGEKKKEEIIMHLFVPHSGRLIHTVQYCHVQTAPLIDVPAPHIFHSTGKWCTIPPH